MLNVLGYLLKRHRISKDLNQGQVSKKAKCSQSSLSLIEKGERFPTENLLNRLLEAIGVNKDEFMEELYELAKKQIDEFSTMQLCNALQKQHAERNKILNKEIPELLRKVADLNNRSSNDKHFIKALPRCIKKHASILEAAEKLGITDDYDLVIK
jgi:transcriptional regulator with XRE-family HTH domain